MLQTDPFLWRRNDKISLIKHTPYNTIEPDNAIYFWPSLEKKFGADSGYFVHVKILPIQSTFTAFFKEDSAVTICRFLIGQYQKTDV